MGDAAATAERLSAQNSLRSHHSLAQQPSDAHQARVSHGSQQGDTAQRSSHASDGDGAAPSLSQLLASKDAELAGLQQQLQQVTEDLRRNLAVGVWAQCCETAIAPGLKRCAGFQVG